MTEDTARRVANAVLTLAAAGAAYYVLRTPQLRRIAVRLATTALTASLPAWVGHEVRRAWTESRQRPPAAGEPTPVQDPAAARVSPARAHAGPGLS